MGEPGVIRELPIATLVAASRKDPGAIAGEGPPAHSAALELFRRALDLNDADAWTAIVELYRATIIDYLGKHWAAAGVHEDDDYWVSLTFERFWRAASGHRFGDFTDLGALLKYLKICAGSVLLDDARARRRTPAASLQDVPRDTPAPASAEQSVVGDLAGEQLWQSLRRELHTEAEEVAYLSVVHDLKPREILSLRPDLFGTVADVTRVKRSVLLRLRKSVAVRAFLETGDTALASVPAAPARAVRAARPRAKGAGGAVRVFLCRDRV